MASRSIICRSQRLRKIIIDLRGTDKSQYFAITEFNNRFIIRSLSLFFKGISSGSEAICHFHARAIARRTKPCSFAHEQNSICSQKQLNHIAHGHTIICRQLFAGHVVGSRPMKRKKHLHRVITGFIAKFRLNRRNLIQKLYLLKLSNRISSPSSCFLRSFSDYL